MTRGNRKKEGMRKIPERKKNEDAIEQNEENYNEMNAELSKHYVFIVFFLGI